MYRKSDGIVKKKTVFGRMDSNFTSKTRFSIGENSIMYRKISGCITKKDRFYKERLKFYIENEVFYRRK